MLPSKPLGVSKPAPPSDYLRDLIHALGGNLQNRVFLDQILKSEAANLRKVSSRPSQISTFSVSQRLSPMKFIMRISALLRLSRRVHSIASDLSIFITEYE